MSTDSHTEKYSYLGMLLVLSVFVFAVSCILGKFGPTYIQNNVCYKYLGCNNGFFGYDIIEHFLSGVMEVVFIVWLFKKYPKTNLFHHSFVKNFIIIIALVACISTFWELGEFGGDQFRLKIWHENLYHPNELFQPSNSDTIGDITFSIIGGLITVGMLQCVNDRLL